MELYEWIIQKIFVPGATALVTAIILSLGIWLLINIGGAVIKDADRLKSSIRRYRI